MAESAIRFDDGAGYEDMMGVWSRLAGEVFIDWLKPPAGLKWIDIGCGNGAATAMIVDLCAPSEIQGIDPSEGQLAYARSRLAGSVATFRQGEGAALPFADASFDTAVMALVIFFLPDPAKGVAEMTRVVRPGGAIATYGWDLQGAASPSNLSMPNCGKSASRRKCRRVRTRPAPILCGGSGPTPALEQIEAREIVVQRTFDDFESFWASSLKGPALAHDFKTLTPDAAEELKKRVRARLGATRPAA